MLFRSVDLPLAVGKDEAHGVVGDHLLSLGSAVIGGQDLGVLVEAVVLTGSTGVRHISDLGHLDLGAALDQLVLDHEGVGDGVKAGHESGINRKASGGVYSIDLLGAVGQEQLGLVIDAFADSQDHGVVGLGGDGVAGYIVLLAVQDQLDRKSVV